MSEPLKIPAYRFTNNSVIRVTQKNVPNRIRMPKPADQWNSIVNYIREVDDVRKNMCGGCGKGYLYDKNNIQYLITRKNTLEEVKGIVTNIRKINNETIG